MWQLKITFHILLFSFFIMSFLGRVRPDSYYKLKEQEMEKGFQTFCGDDILVTAGMTNPCFSFFCTSFFRTSLHGSVRSNYHSLCRLCVNNEFLIIICGTIFWWQLKFDESMFSTSCPSFTPTHIFTHYHFWKGALITREM